jgi:uncharacterized membrane protein YccC
VAGWLAEVWDRIVASDPGLTRLRTAGSAAVSMGSALGVEALFAAAVHANPQLSLISMMLGAVLAMMGSMALAGTGVWQKVRVGVFFPVAMGLGLTAGAMVGDRTELMLIVFVVVMFAAVAVRRFGLPFFFYGFMGWMGYFFASFTQAKMPMVPHLLAAVCVATAWVVLLSVTVLRTNAARTLRRTVRAFDARARAVARSSAAMLRAAGADPKQHARLRRRLHARVARLAEAALMVEGWSAEPRALPPDRSPAALRRRLIDSQQVLDRLATSAEALATTDAVLASAACTVAERLARHDDAGAERTARALAETAEQAPLRDEDGKGTAGWWPARHFAATALEFTALVREAGGPDRQPPTRPDDELDECVDEFEPVLALAMGNLPGSPAVAQGVAARTSGWNPLARLDFVTRQAVQTAVAGGLAIFVGREISQQRYYWAVLAAFIMFTGTATRSESFIKGFNRVLGTLFGLFVSIWLAHLTMGHTPWVLASIVGSMFCGFYLMRISYAYMIFFITIMLGQLYGALNELSSELLVLRLEETSVGAVIGLVVSFAFLPLSTRDTVRVARDNLLSVLAELLEAAADRLDGGAANAAREAAGSAGGAVDDALDGGDGGDGDGGDAGTGTHDLDALSRTLDHRLQQLALVAKPLTRPMIWGNSPPRTRHRLSLYAAATTHARALAVALRDTGGHPTDAAAVACRALATAVTQLSETPLGQAQSAGDGPLEEANTALFALTSTASDARATDPVLRTLIRLQQLLRELAAPGGRHGAQRPLPAAPEVSGARVTSEPVPGEPEASGQTAAGQEPAGPSGPAGAPQPPAGVGPVRAPAPIPGDRAVLTGALAAPDGTPVARGLLVLIDNAGHRAGRLWSDDDGRYRVECAPGGYVVLATAQGHQPGVAHVQLRAGRAHRADLTVTPRLPTQRTAGTPRLRGPARQAAAYQGSGALQGGPRGR